MSATDWQKLGERAVAAGFEWRRRMQATLRAGPHVATVTICRLPDARDEMPGRARVRFEGGDALALGPGGLGNMEEWASVSNLSPDLSDAATLGAYVATLRERAGDETLHARSRHLAKRITWAVFRERADGPVCESAWHDLPAVAWVDYAERLRGQGR